MAKTREKKTVYTGVSQEEMEQAFAEYAKADARQQKIQADMDVQMTKIREKWQEELSKLQEAKDKAFDVMQAFATENRMELFSKKKSMDTVHGTIGFRLGTPKLKNQKGFTWASVTNLLKEFLPAYVRVKNVSSWTTATPTLSNNGYTSSDSRSASSLSLSGSSFTRT